MTEELDIYDLNNHTYCLAPIKLEDKKMFMWYSICSIHRSHAPECALCARGSWQEIERIKNEDDLRFEGHNDSL